MLAAAAGMPGPHDFGAEFRDLSRYPLPSSPLASQEGGEGRRGPGGARWLSPAPAWGRLWELKTRLTELTRTRRAYDSIAASYRKQFENELAEKPFDRGFIDSFTASLHTGARVVDLGCGPGQVGRHMAGMGAAVTAVDLSLGMLHQVVSGDAASDAVQADMRRLPLRGASVDAVVAFYSLIHIPPRDIEGVVREIWRVLRPGGYLAVTTHSSVPEERAGSERLDGGGIRVEEMLGQPVELDFYFYGAGEMTEALEATGFVMVDASERDPYPDVEVQTRRAYVSARKPG